MTQLRDARLKRALQAAPDASALPDEAARRAIREAAQRAVTQAPRKADAWWRRWTTERHVRMPWNAAFATLMLAVLIGVMWRDEQPLPNATQESATTQESAPPPAPTAAPVPPAAPPALQDAPAAKARRAEPIAKPAPARPPAAKAADNAEQGFAKSAPQPSRDAAAAAESRAAAPALAAPAAAPVAPAPMQRAGAVPSAWTELRVTVGARSILAERSQATALAADVERVLASASTSEALSSTPELRIELLLDRSAVTTLEVAGDQVRVTRPGAPDRTGRPDAQVLQQLRDEVARLLAR